MKEQHHEAETSRNIGVELIVGLNSNPEAYDGSKTDK